MGVEENVVVGVKEKGPFSSVSVASIEQKPQRVNSAQKGIFKKVNSNPKKVTREFKVLDSEVMSLGEKIGVEFYQIGRFIDVTSVSKGKGFAGGMKRHNFGGLEATPGVSINHRSIGSTGQCKKLLNKVRQKSEPE